ncbi:hypothetical protein GYA93_18720 [Gordonia desulfuricans]|uniref:AAT family amino acid transporter n=1 Tax=Gordonia desulfuricans TaxID=89051 RepID=A0A7K3LTI9_9ACTN|nr:MULTISPECIES: hypothetical protein [Gordonia]EMP14236.1 membrane protein [Gordonia sp. NB41Y]NDK91595.1 hypothetical protein [Gordonia desulfuricans]WLP88716.1 hypothetical protein Q9K23_13945 [Gordonia sp. NB41Y]
MAATTGIEPPDETQVAPPSAATTTADSRWVAFGLANIAIVVALSLATWYLLADPTTSPWNFYPLPFNAALFWAILFIVFIGFNAEFHGFDRWGQPARGLAILACTAVFAVVVTWLLGSGLGAIFPDFAGSREGGLGYFTGALFVLFGFGTWVMVVLNWQHWPWTALGMKQPLIGLCEIAFVAVPTLALYVVLGLPAVSSSIADPPMSVDTVLGWFYSIVVSVILTGQTLDNWPWKLFGGGGRTALAATIGNVVVGTGIYFIMVPLAEFLVGPTATTELGSVLHQFPAQIGVCWAFWMIFWANGFGNRFAPPIRAVLTFALAIGTFLLYYRFAAQHVLHEPAVADGLYGNALGFIDWLVLWTLIYVVGFGSIGLSRLR